MLSLATKAISFSALDHQSSNQPPGFHLKDEYKNKPSNKGKKKRRVQHTQLIPLGDKYEEDKCTLQLMQ